MIKFRSAFTYKSLLDSKTIWSVSFNIEPSKLLNVRRAY
jgi:hypothetical protein